jgi:quinol monooxygenase YgiN
LKIAAALAKTAEEQQDAAGAGELISSNKEKKMAIAVAAKIKAKAGSEAQVEAAFREMITKVRANEPGTLSYILHRSVQDPTVFYFYETYADQASFDAHGKTAHMKEMGGRIGPHLDGRPEVLVLNELDRK